MAPTDTELPNASPLSPASRLAWAALILVTLYLCYFHNLGAIGLVGPDEPRYAWIARDMAETGDWVTPRLYGQPWFEKPVLYYWGAAASFKLFGVSEATARLPSAISALLATLALAWLALRLSGAETARWLLVLLPTTVGMIGFSHAAATDMPFAGMLTIAMVFAAILLKLVPTSPAPDSPAPLFTLTSSTSITCVLFGFFLGLATLAKGPAAIILSGGAVFLWAAIAKRWRDAFRCLHPLAIASFCLTALPWYILCARRNPDFFRVFIIEHNFKRFLTPEFQHVQPFWYYAPILLIAFLPWTPAVLWSAFHGFSRAASTRRVSPATLLLLSWSCFCILFFSISKSKLPGYILPAIPAIGLLLARSVAQLAEGQEKALRWLLVSFSGICAIAAPVLLALARPPHITNPLGFAMISFACVLLLFGLANLLLANKEHRDTPLRLAAPLCVAPILILLCTFQLVAAPWLRYDMSGKTLARELQMDRVPLEQLFTQPMRRGQQFSLNFYLHREVPAWDPDHPREGYLLLNSRHCQSWVRAPWTCAENPSELLVSGWFVYKIQRSVQ